MSFEEIKKKSEESVMPTYGKFPVAIESGKGSVVTDTQGKQYIDFTSGIGVNSLGHAESGWIAAVTEQINKCAHVSNLYYNPTTVEMGAKLCEISGFSKVFLCNSGAEANECAIKLARKYSFDKYGEGRSTIISLVDSFHGRTMATVTATGQDSFHQYFHPFLPGFRYAKKTVQDLLSQWDETVCAVMMEPIQGEGGVMPLDPAFVKEAAALCKEKDVLLIFDEVQTGVGRTGKFFAWENIGVQPDVLTSAKGLAGGLPVGACLCKEELGNVLGAGAHGTTFGGNPVACAGALRVMEAVTADGFLDDVQKKGRYIKECILKMENVAEVRGQGLMIGIVLKSGTAKGVADRCVANGLLVLTAKALVRLLPPLNITPEELKKGLAILEKSLAEEAAASV